MALAPWLGVAGVVGQGKDAKLPAEVVKILENADQIEVASVDPGNDKVGYKELGSTVVKDAAKRKQIREALNRSVAEGKDPAKCFEPRHINVRLIKLGFSLHASAVKGSDRRAP